MKVNNPAITSVLSPQERILLLMLSFYSEDRPASPVREF